MDGENLTPEVNQIVDQQMPAAEPQLTQEQVVAQTMDQQRINDYNSKGNAIKDWIDTSYDYNPADTGTLWIAGAISDANTQLSFLEATLNEDMYSELDIGKYYFDQNLANARAYAKEKKLETMYGYYKAAQERALAEADLTGWYMPPEAAYMLAQWVTAEEELKRNDISDVDRARAESVVRASESWFNANNITRRGIQTLSHMYYEETVRHNREVEALYDMEVELERTKANNAQKNANYSNRMADYELREWELDSGMDLNEDGVIGFGGSEWEGEFGSYDDVKEWAKDHPMTAMTIMGSSGLKILFGENYERDFNKAYQNESQTKAIDAAASQNKGVLDTNQVPKTGCTISANDGKYGNNSDKNLYYVLYNGEIRYYVNVGTQDDPVFEQVTNINDITLSKGDSLDDFSQFTFKDTELVTRGNSKINVGSNVNYSKMDGSYTKNPEHYKGINDKEGKTITNYEKKGYRIAHGYVDLDKKNSGIIMYKEDAQGNRTYIAIHEDGVAKEVTDESKLLYMSMGSDGKFVWKRADGNDLTGWQQSNVLNYEQLVVDNQTLTYTIDGKETTFIIDSNGKMIEYTTQAVDGNYEPTDNPYANTYTEFFNPNTDVSGYLDEELDDFEDYRDGNFNIIDDNVKVIKKPSKGSGGKGSFGGGGSMGGGSRGGKGESPKMGSHLDSNPVLDSLHNPPTTTTTTKKETKKKDKKESSDKSKTKKPVGTTTMGEHLETNETLDSMLIKDGKKGDKNNERSFK